MGKREDRVLRKGMLLGGSWVVISRVISSITILITHIKGLITPRITTHEPPSRDPYSPENTIQRFHPV